MAKVENRVEPILANRKIDIEGVDMTRARSKKTGIRFLSMAVREALEGAPQVLHLTEAEQTSISNWIEKHLLGVDVSPNVLVSACGTAVTTLSANVRRMGAPPVPVKAGAVAAAMKRAMELRENRRIKKENKKEN